MTEPEEVLHTRRSILSLALGLVAAGCASANSGRSATAHGFPYPADWCYRPANAGELERLGKIIVRDRNPYCELAAQTPGAVQCDATNTATWPKALTDETTWKVLTEFDFLSNMGPHWPFTTTYSAAVTRSMRIPYLIGQGKAKKKNVVKVGRENLLVGYEPAGGTASSATSWGTPDNCQDSIGELALFITDNMMRDGDTASFYVPNWFMEQAGLLESGLQNVTWYFRRTPIVVDYSFRIPVATRKASEPAGLGWIYVGYEGGGSY
jgi:hypothetical protein